jgi:hypothetical protein
MSHTSGLLRQGAMAGLKGLQKYSELSDEGMIPLGDSGIKMDPMGFIGGIRNVATKSLANRLTKAGLNAADDTAGVAFKRLRSELPYESRIPTAGTEPKFIADEGLDLLQDLRAQKPEGYKLKKNKAGVEEFDLESLQTLPEVPLIEQGKPASLMQHEIPGYRNIDEVAKEGIKAKERFELLKNAIDAQKRKGIK